MFFRNFCLMFSGWTYLWLLAWVFAFYSLPQELSYIFSFSCVHYFEEDKLQFRCRFGWWQKGFWFLIIFVSAFDFFSCEPSAGWFFNSEIWLLELDEENCWKFCKSRFHLSESWLIMFTGNIVFFWLYCFIKVFSSSWPMRGMIP